MSTELSVHPRHRPALDPDFVPAVLWNRAYRARVKQAGGVPFALCLERGDGTRSTFRTHILPHEGDYLALNRRYLERLLKFLLWQKGGWRIHLGGCPEAAAMLASIYSSAGERAFDHEFMGRKVYGREMEFATCSCDEVPDSKELDTALGRHLDGCRIGFDLGGSDRKCAAVMDGKLVHSEEVPWSPYFETDPAYHWAGMNDSLRRAAAKLPRVDAIGGSAAGIYVNNEVRVASLFRGIPAERFEAGVRPIFHRLQQEWGVPLVVLNDGDVTALAGSMTTGQNGVLGIAMGTAEAAGYINAGGKLTSWLSELAFAPIDYQADAGLDEWSGDRGCGVQYFSQQGVGRLVSRAGIELPAGTGLPEQLVEVQTLLRQGDPRARAIFETIGVWFGYAVAHYAEFYDIQNLLVLGRVTSGEGGEVLLANARTVLREEFPALAGSIRFRQPDEQEKRHGQAVAAASLPELGSAG